MDWCTEKNINRKMVVILFIVIGFIFLVLGVLIVLPHLIEQLKLFWMELPDNAERVMTGVEKFFMKWGFNVHYSHHELKSWIGNYLSSLSVNTIKDLSLSFTSIFGNLLGTLIGIFNFLLFPLFFYYIMNDYEKLKNECVLFVPQDWRQTIFHYTSLMHTIFKNYFRGQLSVAMILGVLYAFGLSIIGIRFGILIGLVTGLTSIIPYVGAVLGFSLSMFMAFSMGGHLNDYGGVILIFIIVQTLEGLLITPRLVGNKVGLSVLTSILALMIGGNMGGFLGLVVAIPMAGFLKVLLKDIRDRF
jgi:predicted PurR-regulated permease PerM